MRMEWNELYKSIKAKKNFEQRVYLDDGNVLDITYRYIDNYELRCIAQCYICYGEEDGFFAEKMWKRETPDWRGNLPISSVKKMVESVEKFLEKKKVNPACLLGNIQKTVKEN